MTCKVSRRFLEETREDTRTGGEEQARDVLPLCSSVRLFSALTLCFAIAQSV